MKYGRWTGRITWGLAIVSFVGGATLLSMSGDDAGSAETAASPESKDSKEAPKESKEAKAEGEGGASEARAPSGATDDVGESDFSNERVANGQLPVPPAIDDVAKQRAQLSARAKELDAREAELKNKEQALVAEMKKLEQLRDDIAKIDSTRKKENDEKVAKLVETVETMSPKASAAMLAQLDEQLAVSTMSKMATPKLAKVLNIMEPAKSSRLSELLAGVIRSKNQRVPASIGAEAAAPKEAAAPESALPKAARGGNPSKEGGERYDGQNLKQQQPAGERKSPAQNS